MSGRKRLVELGLDRLIHEKARLMILTYLSSGDAPETGFTELRDALELSSGNLSIQLKTLEEAGYVAIEKSFKNNKPYTAVRLSVEGRRALDGYLGELETILTTARSKRGEAT
ncbi:MAG: transcriptional regulator [Spirochaetae bacterium HGW-Spirochaetae-3]|jgi:DNA-binding MarR family transcriptional regulator|nr:MAG: transcriptional regulator [Spirochaetae bacterium HGW-Spirochaetae-3]